MTKDMTTGDPVKLILYFSIPLLIGNIFQQFYSMVDTIIVGRFLGVDALAAVGLTGSLNFLIIGFVMGLASGFSVLVSQKFGANDEEGLKKAVASAIILSVIMSILITIVSVLSVMPLLRMMNTPENIIDSSAAYITVIFAGTAATFFYNMISGILRALGDSKTPLYFLIVSSILNVVLDLVFIVNLSMGVAGAAYATVISQGVSSLLCLIYTAKKFPILKMEKRHFKVESEYIKQHLRIGVPMALQFSITAIGAIVVQGAVNGFGSTVVGAFTAASRVEQLVMQPAISFGITMSTYSAQNLGAGNIERIREGMKKCTIVNIVIGLIAGLILVLFGKMFIGLFVSNPSPELMGYAYEYLVISGLFFIPLSLIFIYRGTLQGMGYTFMPMMAGVAELLARSVVAFTLPGILGYAGICLAGPMAWVCAAVLLIFDYIKKMNAITSPSKACTASL